MSTYNLSEIRAEADAMRDVLVAVRRDLHAHPELAFEEVRTAGIVARTLGELGYEVQTGVGKTGVVGVMEANDPNGETLLLRFDMDALPVHEAVDVDFKSTVEGKMHACGHDAHTSIGLGVARMLANHRELWRGTVKFVFQPAEEIVGGARAMIADGVLQNPAPTRSLSMHVWSMGEVGAVVSDLFELLYARSPNDDEVRRSIEFLKQTEAALLDVIDLRERRLQAWAALCRTLMAGNEFIYVE